MFRRVLLCLCLVGVLATLGACASQEPREQALTGEPQHERHDTGIDSQVGDN